MTTFREPVLHRSLTWLNRNISRIVRWIGGISIVFIFLGGIWLFYPVVMNNTKEDIFLNESQYYHDPTRPTITLAVSNPTWHSYENRPSRNESSVQVTVEDLRAPHNWSWEHGGCYTSVRLGSLKSHFFLRGYGANNLIEFDPDICYTDTSIVSRFGQRVTKYAFGTA